MELKETISIMQSDNYKDRFKAEYWQTKIRYEKLKDFCNKIEARDVLRFNAHPDYQPSMLEPIKHDCPFELLRTQQRQMGEYLHTLELRAEIERIEL